MIYYIKNKYKIRLPNKNIIYISKNTSIINNKYFLIKNMGLYNIKTQKYGNLYIPIN